MSSVPPLRNADRARRAPRQFVGRPAELDRLATAAREDGPVVTFVLGIGGIGKTSLLDALGERLDRDAVPWRRLDCESVEPTPTGLLAAIGASYCGSGVQRFKPAWSPKKPLFGVSNVKWLSRIEVTDSRFEGPFQTPLQQRSPLGLCAGDLHGSRAPPSVSSDSQRGGRHRWAHCSSGDSPRLPRSRS